MHKKRDENYNKKLQIDADQIIKIHGPSLSLCKLIEEYSNLFSVKSFPLWEFCNNIRRIPQFGIVHYPEQ
jgi:hypothetical protein